MEVLPPVILLAAQPSAGSVLGGTLVTVVGSGYPMNDASLACVFGPTVPTGDGINGGGANGGGNGGTMGGSSGGASQSSSSSSTPSSFGGISTIVSVSAVVISSTLLQCTAPPALVPGPVALTITRRGVLISPAAR